MNQLQTEAETQAVWMTNMSAVLDSLDPFAVPALSVVEPQQFEHRYADALAVLVTIEGAGKFANACEIVSRIFSTPVAQVITDAACFA
jgi:uncharacterized membrane protein